MFRKIVKFNVIFLIANVVSNHSYSTVTNTMLKNKTSYCLQPLNKHSNLINEISYIDSNTAKNIDISLMSKGSFSIDQLMELAGLSVASAVVNYYNRLLEINNKSNKNVLIICGPGNNGGDGLVAARHLKHFGFNPTILYLSPSKSELYNNLINQCSQLTINVITDATSTDIEGLMNSNEIIVDSIFGFSFKGKPREPYDNIINLMTKSKTPVLSVDIPSGWDVELGDIHKTGFLPQAVISLTVPKLCMKGYKGKHYVGGRFVPPYIADEFSLVLPNYGSDVSQIVELVNESPVNLPLNDISILFVTVPNIEEGENIASILLQDKLVACVNIIPSITSMYVWEGKLEKSSEVLLKIKTKSNLVNEVTNKIKNIHSYDVPEILSISTNYGNKDYIDWVKSSTKDE